MPRGQRALPPEESAAWMSTSSDDGTCTVCGHKFNPAIVADAARPTVCPSCASGFGPSNERAKPEVEREELNGAKPGEAVTGHTELTTLSPEYRSPLERDQAPTQRRTPLLATDPFDVERAFDDIRQLNASVVAARNDYRIKKEWASAAKKRLDKLEEELSDLISERGAKALAAERAAKQPSLEVVGEGSDTPEPTTAQDGVQEVEDDICGRCGHAGERHEDQSCVLSDVYPCREPGCGCEDFVEKPDPDEAHEEVEHATAPGDR